MAGAGKSIFWLFFFLTLGLVWSWFGSIYDLRWPQARLVLSSLTALASIGLMYFGLRMAGAAGKVGMSTAALAVLPWNGVYLSQLAYLGFFFIPLEIFVSAYILRRRASLAMLPSLGLAALVRGASAGIMFLCIGWARSAWG